MEPVAYNLQIVVILAVGFTYASILGYISKRIGLSPILGYLLAGYLIGPFSPGFVADIATAEQLAEIGVILMMFGVGLVFNVQDLVRVKNIAVLGAFVQIITTTLIGMGLTYSLGWPLVQGFVFGLSIGVASTVVLARVLGENHLLKTNEGHIAIGWLLVEDIITIAILLLIPSLSSVPDQINASIQSIFLSVGMYIFKFLVLALIVFLWGKKVVSFALNKIVATESDELFTLSVLAMTFLIAIGSTLFLGTSIALGAFIAGMIIGQTEVRRKALLHSSSMMDAFVVIFFISMGILFNPLGIIQHYLLFVGVLAIVLFVKPLTAFVITKLMKYPAKTALVIGVSLAQIGEFSFIVSEEAMRFKLMPDEGFDIIIGVAIISIAMNPSLFRKILTRTT